MQPEAEWMRSGVISVCVSPGQMAVLWVSRPGLGTTQMGRECQVGERGLLWHLLSLRHVGRSSPRRVSPCPIF